MTGTDWLWLVPALPLAGFLVNGALALWRPGAKTAVSVVGVGVVVAAFGVALALVLGFAPLAEEGPAIVRYWSWMPVGDLQLDVAFQLDQLAGVMLLVVTGVGALIHLFSVGYMGAEPAYARYFAYLNLFVFFMLVLVLGASFPVMFVGWEGVGLCSYLLIGYWYNEKINADAGKKAFIVNRIGDFGFLAAMFLLWRLVGALDFATVFERAPQALTVGGGAVTAITLFLFLGCTGKSAQIPLYTWLPDAMQGPTPVSALIHAATMVTAGVYLVARTNVLFAMAPAASAVVAGVGALTALFAATIALKQWDIKRVLAYSTVSQLGYMFLGVGTGAYAAGIFHLTTHAFFKALLFLGSGSVIHAMHHAYHATHAHEDAQDMRNMGGLRRHLPWTWALMWIATLAIAGIPPLSGFFSKDEILAAAFARAAHAPLWYVFWGLGLGAALLTAFYMTRMMLYTFHGPNRSGPAAEPHLHEAPWVMTGPLVVLGALSLAGGILNLPAIVGGGQWLHHWLEPVTAGGVALLDEAHLTHGTELALIGVAVGIALLGLAAAWRLLRPAALVPARLAPPETGVGRILWKKWYVDELYDLLFVRPTVWISRVLLWKVVDQGVVDGAAVNGSARLSRLVGLVGSKLQTGEIGFYVVLFVVGVVWLVARAVGGGS
jgi:NADH-quinone oxidoreductase subunit L